MLTHRYTCWIALLSCLLRAGGSSGQRLTVCVDGYERWQTIQAQVSVPGPLSIRSTDLQFTYGLSMAYQSGRNGVEAGIMAFPHRIDLQFRHFINEQNNPSNITLFTLLYRRKLVTLNKLKVDLYALAGVGIGRYRYDKIQYGTGTISVNGTVVFSDHLDVYSTYSQSVVLLPMAQIELDKRLSRHLFIRGRAAYVVPNFAGLARPLEQATYSYTYQQQHGNGTLANYGNGFMIGLSLGYQLDLR